MEQFSGEIMTAFFMLVLMLGLVIHLLLKTKTHHVEQIRIPNFNENLERQKSYTPQREKSFIPYVFFFSLILILVLYYTKNPYEGFVPKDTTAKSEIEKPESSYPTIGVNPDQYVFEKKTEETEEKKEIPKYPHPPILPFEYEKDPLKDQNPKAVPSKDGFSCQVGAYSSKEKAEKALKIWSDEKNIEGFIGIQIMPDGTISYKVLLGYFVTLEAATAFTKKLGTGYPRPSSELQLYYPETKV